jgi:hypothetical protein
VYGGRGLVRGDGGVDDEPEDVDVDVDDDDMPSVTELSVSLVQSKLSQYERLFLMLLPRLLVVVVVVVVVLVPSPPLPR